MLGSFAFFFNYISHLNHTLKWNTLNVLKKWEETTMEKKKFGKKAMKQISEHLTAVAKIMHREDMDRIEAKAEDAEEKATYVFKIKRKE